LEGGSAKVKKPNRSISIVRGLEKKCKAWEGKAYLTYVEENLDQTT